MECGLCLSSQLSLYYTDLKRQWGYYLCENCQLVFRDPQTYLLGPDEKARYETHNNSIENLGYVKFLSPVVELLRPHLKLGDKGLDFGSGPGPILDELFKKEGFEVLNYDPYFENDKSRLETSYDFITCTEVFEHLYRPSLEMDVLTNLIKPQGFLVLMSEFRTHLDHFSNWGYRMDNTHVCFLNDVSLQFLCNQWGFDLISYDGRRLALLQKKVSHSL